MKPPLPQGLSFQRFFTKEGVSPFGMFEYEQRSSIIKNADGEKIFEMLNVEVPSGWSQIATDILAQKYFRKAGVPQKDGTSGSETSIKQVAHRMANCWRVWGSRNHYFATEKDAQIFYEESVYSILNQSCVPNSPQWFNTGLHESYQITGKPQGHYYVDPISKAVTASTSAYERPQPHACFILGVTDDLVNEGGIMDLFIREARIFKYGSGVGSNFSTVRGAGEKLSGGGTSSGLMSFLKIGDRAAGAIKSGGTTRRAAKMVCLDIDHPEILEFINWKVAEEKKVAALIASGYDNHYEGEAYATVSGQNSNNSVRVSNAFFKALATESKWALRGRVDGKPVKTVSAKKLWQQISYAAWRCADPGVQFDTTINEWHTCPQGGRINASNPCSEYMFLDNTACNLASINLRKFHDEETNVFDVEGFEYISRLWTIILEISILMAQFPSKEVARLSYEYRTTGLGFANLGSVLMVDGIPYDSEAARAFAAAITAIMTGIAYKTSAELASFLGTFDQYEANKNDMLRVIRNHRAAAYDASGAYENLDIKPIGISAASCPDYLLRAAQSAWDAALQMGEKYGYRNAQTTVIAPTGTIGLVMDCDTTGVEPDFALVKFKKLSGGGYFKIINQSVPQALKNLKYMPNEIATIVKYAMGAGAFVGAPHINPETLIKKGFSTDDIDKLNVAAKTAFDISFVFNYFTLGANCIERLGFTTEQYTASSFDLLKNLGFTQTQIEEANEYVCGTMMLEGAPFLKQEHLAVFDCANQCGRKGKRYIHAFGHIKMMAACQPFLSGAISKTINLPNEATVEEIETCYKMSWELGLKATALYRDGSKLSQPLSNKKEEKVAAKKEPITMVASNIIDLSQLTIEDLLEEMTSRMKQSPDTQLKRRLSRIVKHKALPPKRRGFTQKAKIGGQALYLHTGEYSDGTLGEIFIDLAKEGSTIRSLVNCFAIAVSVGLQYGVPLEEYVEKFIFTKFDPSGVVDHPNIKIASSLVDFIFRSLAYEYLDRTDLVQVIPKSSIKNMGDGSLEQELSSVRVTASHQKIDQPKPLAVAMAKLGNDDTIGVASSMAKSMQSDAPACNVCGHITIRSGTCYKCLNCGNSLGCS